MTQVQPRGLTNKAQLSDDVAAYVRDLIMSGQIRQGEYIRLEPLADQLGISATPVREGLLALRGEGFVQLAPRRGFIVSPLSRKDVRDLFMIQASVAGELAARAAVDIDGAQVKHVFALQATLESAALAGDPEDIEVANFEFHRAINRIADSPKLAGTLSMVVRYAPRRFYATIHGWQQASVNDHRAICAALRDNSADAARETMRRHILHAGNLLVAHLANSHFWGEESTENSAISQPDANLAELTLADDLFRPPLTGF